MALQVRGVDILTLPEFTRLMRGLEDQNAEAPPILVAWFEGYEIDPHELHLALDIEVRLIAGTDEAQTLIDLALDRLEEAFPGEAIEFADDER